MYLDVSGMVGVERQTMGGSPNMRACDIVLLEVAAATAVEGGGRQGLEALVVPNTDVVAS